MSITPTETESLLMRHEGFRSTPYRCPAGKLTIGYGINLDAGITPAEGLILLRHRLIGIEMELFHIFPWFSLLSKKRKDVLIDMTYNLGLQGLLNFKMMLNA